MSLERQGGSELVSSGQRLKCIQPTAVQRPHPPWRNASQFPELLRNKEESVEDTSGRSRPDCTDTSASGVVRYRVHR